MRLTDADALIELVWRSSRSAIQDAIENAPTIEAEPVRHGHWQWVDGVRCSICNHKLQTTGLPSYCPNCGAKMDEVEDAEKTD